MTARLYVVEFQGSKELVYWLEERLREAAIGRDGRRLIGIAAVCMYSHNDYAISIRGEIRRSPTFTRGLLPEMDYQLARIIRGRAP